VQQDGLCLARRPPPLPSGGSRAFSALLPSATCTQASLCDNQATHRAPELPSVTGMTSFGVLRQRLQGAWPRFGPDGSTATASFGSTAAWVRAPPRQRRCGQTTVGLDLGPTGLDLGLIFFSKIIFLMLVDITRTPQRIIFDVGQQQSTPKIDNFLYYIRVSDLIAGIKDGLPATIKNYFL
jgi:hypothetical protein